jgi:hydrogenase large subunit
MTVKTIFPVTRIRSPLRIDVDIEGGRVRDAYVAGTLFRGFENIMTGRDPRDAALLLERICGICSSAHAVAAGMAQQQVFGVRPTPNGQLLTNLIFAADIIQNHLRYFYLMALYDYCPGFAMPPYTPRARGDYRLSGRTNDELLLHAKQGIELSSRAHEMLAIFGAKAPHQQTIMPTGITEKASSERLMAYGSILREIKTWVEAVHISDVMTIADAYKDYYNIGAGYGHLMSCGMFEQPVSGERSFKPGVIISRGPVQEFDDRAITEHIRYSWYQDSKASRVPSEGITVPQFGKEDAYSWIKAPRYQGFPVESGPLARAWINGEYRRGISVMDRLVARAQEILKICMLAADWLEQVVPGAPAYSPYTPGPDGEAAALTDAMRGVLGHWMTVKNHKVGHYQVVTPTAWNFSPRDNDGLRGPVEEALIGTAVTESEELMEVGRIVRSFDPCLTCAVHIMDASDADVRLI